MVDYVYKGFNIHYDLKKSPKTKSTYQANASVICAIKSGDCRTQKFQTEALTKADAEQDIQRLINHYIDFEWDQFDGNEV